MISDRALQDVDEAWSTAMVMNRTEDGSGLEGKHAHS
jgi:hypothetical protein